MSQDFKYDVLLSHSAKDKAAMPLSQPSTLNSLLPSAAELGLDATKKLPGEGFKPARPSRHAAAWNCRRSDAS